MKRVLILSVFSVLALSGCGRAVTENASGRSATVSPAFVQAKDGTLYSVTCLKSQSAAIEAGVASAGKDCAAENLDQEQVRGMRGLYGASNYYYYANPAPYYGGSNSHQFCRQYFGLNSNTCYGWLGYNQSWFNSSYYQPTCSSYTNVSISISYGYPAGNQYPSGCVQQQTWQSQPWYRNWNSWNWWYAW